MVRDADGAVLHADPPKIAVEVPPDRAVGRWYESHSREPRPPARGDVARPGLTTILVGRPIHHELGRPPTDGVAARSHGFGVFSAGLAGGWWLSSRAVRPIVAMSETVSGINASSLSRRLDLKGVDTELGGLGTLINTMLERLEGSFEQQVRFTADASHELRTPLAVILSQVELALSRPREGPAYRESLEACGRAGAAHDVARRGPAHPRPGGFGKLELRIEPIDLAQVAEATPRCSSHSPGSVRCAFIWRPAPAP